MYVERQVVFKLSLQFIINTLKQLAGIFGIKLEQSELKDDEIWALINAREKARHDKDFIRSDEIREELKARGIILEDTPQGTRFRKE